MSVVQIRIGARDADARPDATGMSVALVLVGVAWMMLVALDATGVAAAVHHHALIEAPTPLWVSAPLFLGAWAVMIAAMMLPASLPAVRSVVVAAATRVPRSRTEIAFLAGFLAVWVVFGLAALLGDTVVHRVVDSTPWLAGRPWLITAGVLAIAGGYQFVPRRSRALERCRRPAEHVPATVATLGVAARAGLDHGLACLGASWALMLLMFGEGFGSLPWMVALTAVMVLEASLPSARRLSAAVGVGLILLSISTLSGPFA
jgi:predicted metal-binding membrane protein